MACGWTILFMFMAFNAISALRITNFSVPEYVVLTDPKLVYLICDYDLEGEELNHVKWYKDHSEFYEFKLTDTPAQKKFFVGGADVDLRKSSPSRLFLSGIVSGLYRCEVSASSSDGPQYVVDEGTLTVVEFRPTEEPSTKPSAPPSGVVVQDDVRNVTLSKYTKAPLCTDCNVIVIVNDLKNLMSNELKEPKHASHGDSSHQEEENPQPLCDNCNFLIAENEQHMKKIIENVIHN